ncbi:MAG: hypothetical protein KKE39_00755 [Bacteroidetes bacterium]|nr:hypothetical protein [Bacteroidota bacterium]MBU1372754.1 hypothetical protein [Bacteroidota bacterium]MBU1484950.1 hypothetical protein [Bacteroidota bacterium]MBU1761342.1 hypothetical protein [Bacteroidota bacterium]MBU2046156.1 hypothetical protein [Bacteroidota bacterium]
MKRIFMLLAISSLMISKIYSQQTKSIHLTAFDLTEIPDSLMGSSCVYSASKVQHDANKFLFFDDLNGTCIIKIDHQIIIIKAKENKYTYGDYTIYIQKENKIAELDEGFILNAELVIIDRKGNKVIRKVYGSCGS